MLEEIGFGVVGGLVAGVLGAFAVRIGRERGWTATAWAPLVPLAATGMAYGLATVLHGSGLIAAFTAGLAFGAIGIGPGGEGCRDDRDGRRCLQRGDVPRLRRGDRAR